MHWLSEMGQGLGTLAASGCNLVVTTVACRFIAPAFLGEQLRIETGLVTAKRVQAQWAQVALREGELVAAQRINFAAVNLVGKPMRMPPTLTESMVDFQLPDGWHERELPELGL